MQYAPEPCAYCGGTGAKERQLCPACGGKRQVLVHQPAITCPRCHGNGKATDNDRAAYYSSLCVICRGTGWVLTQTP
ncbi:MAG TPA: transcriptional regulator [Blastocatellia bacterium]|nr:transcriptional regulator [Blastocatellia bacterium]